MPTYEFRCPKGHDFEKFYRSIGSAPSEVRCPICNEIAERQLSAGAGLVFKGSGFYITDYGKDGKKPQPTSGPTARNDGAREADAAAAKSESSPAGESKSGSEAKPGADSKSGGESKSLGGPKSGGDARTGGIQKAGTGSKSESKPAASKPTKPGE